MHRLARHVHQSVVTTGLDIVSISDLENDSSSFRLNVVEESFQIIQQSQYEMYRLGLLYAVEHTK